MKILEVIDLSKEFFIYQLNKLVKVLRGISFELSKGELIAVMGPSGSGKSTLLKCLAGIYKPTSGHILFFLNQKTLDLVKVDDYLLIKLRKSEIGYMPQKLRTNPRTSPMELVFRSAFESQKFSIDESKFIAEDLLSKVGIPRELWDMPSHLLSEGQQQRVALAIALAKRPRLLLLDEPTASLDSFSAQLVCDILKSEKERGTAILGVFHSHQPSFDLVDRVIELRR